VNRLPQVKLDLLSTLLRCPTCESHALDLRPEAVVCTACGKSYAVDNGIIDFVGDVSEAMPAFYQNRFYRRFMGSIAQLHDAHYKDDGFSGDLEDRIKRDLFNIVSPSNEVSVDLGCGHGNAFPRIGAEENIIGVDFELALLRETQKRFPKASLFRADLGSLPFRTGSLKRVFANAVLEHVFHLEKALAHIQRSMAADGVFYVIIPTEGSLAVWAARLYTSSRNAKVTGMTAAQCRIAQTRDHCNTIYLLENAFRKYFTVERSRLWPFKVGGTQVNLTKSYCLKTIVPDV
jgi:ubiquinone/menaquinone biosynthesis C-methylase UbiE